MKTKKYFLIFLIIILYTSLVSSSKLGISPGKIDFNIERGSEECKKINIFTDYKGFIIGKDLWAEKGISEKNLNKYNLKPENLGIKINYPQKINMSNLKEEIKICINPEKDGNFNGALLYSIDNGSAGVGIWISVLTGKNETEIKESNREIKLTGSVISEENQDIHKKYKFLAVLEVIFLFFLLMILSRYNKAINLKFEK